MDRMVNRFPFVLVMAILCLTYSFNHVLRQKNRLMSTLLKARIFDSVANKSNAIKEASNALKNGKLVAFPTETVYGLGANALDNTAVQAIFDAKGRPSSNPLIVHVLGADQMDELFDYDTDGIAKDVCKAIALSLWPGPITIVHKAKSIVPSLVTASTGRVALRCPNHKIARSLLYISKIPIAAPSANKYGHVSPTKAAHVIEEFADDERVSVLLDDEEITGGCSIGIESTVCRVSDKGDEVVVLREGAISSRQITAMLRLHGLKDLQVNVTVERNFSRSIHNNQDSPGQNYRHYAPNLPTYITGLEKSRSTEGFTAHQLSKDALARAMIIDFGQELESLRDQCAYYVNLSPAENAKEACKNIFAALRAAESEAAKQRGVELVLLVDLRPYILEMNPMFETMDDISEIDDSGMIRALWDRFKRAAAANYATWS